MEPSGGPEPRELQELSIELRKLEVERQRLDLERARALDSAERRHRRQEVRALTLANDAKEREGKFWRSGVFWTRVGLLVGWIAVLVPVTISLNQYFDQRSAANEERRAAAIKAARTRFTSGESTAAFDLLPYKEGVATLIAAVRGVMGDSDDVERTRAALTALQSASVELTDGHRRLLRDQRDLGIEHLANVAATIDAGRQIDRTSFLVHCEVNRELRRLLGEDGELWTSRGPRIQEICDFSKTSGRENDDSP